MTQQVTITINGQPYDSRDRAAPAAGAFHPRGGGTHRHAHRLRHHQLWSLHRAGKQVSQPSPARMLAVQADGAEIRTVEGLEQNGQLHPVQQGFVEEHGLQCGFCTPGMMMTAVALLENNPRPTEEEIRWAISGNLCRCTGLREHRQIDSVRRQANARGASLFFAGDRPSGGELDMVTKPAIQGMGHSVKRKEDPRFHPG